MCSDAHSITLSIRNENNAKIDKLYNYMFENTLNAKRRLKMFKLRGGLCVMVEYGELSYVNVSSSMLRVV